MVLIGKYGDYSIQQIEKKFDSETKYTNIEVDKINPGFTDIKISNSYGNIELGIDPTASYKINANGKYCNIETPQSNTISRNDDGSSVSVTGIIGTDSESKSSVTIESRYGNVEL